MKVLQIFLFLGFMTSSLQTFASDGIDGELRDLIKEFDEKYGHLLESLKLSESVSDDKLLDFYLQQKTFDSGSTPLHLALRDLKFWRLAEFFIKKGADLQKAEVDRVRRTPLELFIAVLFREYEDKRFFIKDSKDQIKTILTRFYERDASVRKKLYWILRPYHREAFSRFAFPIRNLIIEIDESSYDVKCPEEEETYFPPELAGYDLTENESVRPSNSSSSSSGSSFSTSSDPLTFVRSSEF